MGYRIEYQPVRKLRGLQKRRCIRPALTGLFFLLFLLAVNLLWPEGQRILRGLLFSGDYAVTAAAMEDFSQNLETGFSLNEALFIFCRQIMEGQYIGSG